MDDLYYRALPFSAADLRGDFNGVKTADGCLCLDGAAEGVFTSEPITVPECDVLLVSWNCYRRGGSVEMQLSYIKEDGTQSGFFSYGVWGAKPASKSVKTDEGTMDEDTLTLPVKTKSVVVRAVLTAGEDGSGDPRLLRFAVAHNGKPNRRADVSDLPEEVSLDVSPRSQMSVPEIGRIICSPTSTAMCMDYKGVSLPTEDAAAQCYDYGAKIYGNWLFNIACAGENGFEAHFDIYDVDAARRCLAAGTPMAFSIRTNPGQIKNAPQAYVHGHLICVVGYKRIDGRLYFEVNDPACGDVNEVRRFYDAAELDSGWKLKAVYVIR